MCKQVVVELTQSCREGSGCHDPVSTCLIPACRAGSRQSQEAEKTNGMFSLDA